MCVGAREVRPWGLDEIQSSDVFYEHKPASGYVEHEYDFIGSCRGVDLRFVRHANILYL